MRASLSLLAWWKVKPWATRRGTQSECEGDTKNQTVRTPSRRQSCRETDSFSASRWAAQCSLSDSTVTPLYLLRTPSNLLTVLPCSACMVLTECLPTVCWCAVCMELATARTTLRTLMSQQLRTHCGCEVKTGFICTLSALQLILGTVHISHYETVLTP